MNVGSSSPNNSLMSTTNDPILTSTSKNSSSNYSKMSSTNDPKMPASLATILAKMKKRQAEAPAEDKTKTKKAYTGNLRIDLNATIISAWNSEKSERFTVVVSNNGLDKLEKSERSNGYFEDGVIKIRPQNSEDYSQQIIPGDVFECSRWHGGKSERVKKTYKFGQSVVLKRVSIKEGDNGMCFNNVHWVEYSTEQFPMTIPKSMTDLEADSYHKAVVIGGESNVSNATFGELKLTSSGKIYTRLSFNYGEEGDQEGSSMFWQEKLFQFGIYNPETLESVLPKILETSITIIGNKEKDEGFESDALKLNVRALLLGAGTLQQYIEEYGTHLTKAKVVKELGATVNSDLNEGHPLNSSTDDTTVLNLNEWSGNIKGMSAAVKFYKLFDTVIFAVLA